ncbi:hypothetical protein [Actinacidiphila guanduensis]|uniref:Uncharacterized protein n=1 Tax=Actinacidiphila guanduensis TaxID=310781 RepID=A0A1H0QW41_9ACTN|nr:hypothetical protein [Actinacidiphila guanduensis]SDP21484.1 hypothetical protein SAMN05216259_12018 [Actinacidiphila guanduensis]
MSTTMGTWVRRGAAVAGTLGALGGYVLLSAAGAQAAGPALPADVRQAAEELGVQVSNGWEAVTGPAAAVEEVRTLAAADGIGTLTAYTGDGETGQAILIFTGDDSVGAFDISGASIHSVDNATDQTWYVFDDSGAPDASVPANTSADIPPVDAEFLPQGVSPTTSTTAHFTL